MNQLKAGILVFALVFAPLTGLSAQTTEDMAQPDGTPKRWLTAMEVEDIFGVPQMKSDPVGIPVITYWEYSDYIVYFENDRVLHSFRINK